MPLLALAELPETGPLLALDPGGKRIGMAVCDSARSLVSPVQTIHRSKFAADAAVIFEAYDGRDCAGLVIGLPVNMDGTEGPRAQSARALARNLLKIRDIPVAMHDERLTSMEAGDRLRAAGVKPGRRQDVIDQMAAVLILESALTHM